ANPNYLAPPTSLTAVADGPDAIKMSWTAPAIAAGKPRLAGFYLYAKAVAAGVVHTFKSPLPFAVIGPSETTIPLGGLDRYAYSNYYVRVAAVDEAGRVSIGNPEVMVLPGAETSLPRPPGSVKTVLWTVNDPVNGRGRNGIKVAWKKADAISGSTHLGFR